VERVLTGESRAIAEALACLEDTRGTTRAVQRELIACLECRTPAAHTSVGLTGPPGAGKSTLAAALIRHWLAEGLGVGMTAVDPTSQRSGGALLGDRARVRVPATERVFIRSLAARDRLGGLAPATRATVVVLRAAFPWTLIETVGVGQSEVAIESVADAVVLVLQPGSGDTLQFMKAGILEIPDVLVINKWDLGAVAGRTRSDLESILALSPTPEGAWQPRVVGVSAQDGDGIPALVQALGEHRGWLDASGELGARRARARRIWALELFAERYGTLGLERLGGREAAERLAAESGGTPLDAFSSLARRAGLEPDPG
jgi:LAO/AO transport system kinase